MIGIKFDLKDVEIHDSVLHGVLKGENGPVAKHMKSIGRQTVLLAKGLAGVKTGRLKRSIKMERDLGINNEYAILVGSDVRHALVHHMGAAPHRIRPKRPGGVLVFRGKFGVVFAREVNHRGHEGNEYLTKALAAAMAAAK